MHVPPLPTLMLINPTPTPSLRHHLCHYLQAAPLRPHPVPFPYIIHYAHPQSKQTTREGRGAMEGVGGMGTINGISSNSGTKGTSRVSWSIWPMEEEEWHSFEPNPPHPLPISSTFPSYPNDHLMLTPFSTSATGSLNGGGGAEAHHHLTCLKLGKRQYYEEPLGHGGVGAKKEKAAAVGSSSSSSTAVPRCQVEGCNVGLGDAKEYHKRHKVCEAHSKSPKVVVLGLEQRFCQQCSRFHVLSEFDDAKRSCRRRLAGHNERRRKSSSNDSSITRNSPLDFAVGMGGRFPYLPPSTPSPGCALSLLSSEAPSRWVSPDLSYRSSAALRELIAENRAALFSRQPLSDRNSSMASQAFLSYVPHQQPVPVLIPGQLPEGWEQFQDDSGAHVTLDLMQVPSSSYNVLSSGRSNPKEDDECCEIWKSLEETHVV